MDWCPKLDAQLRAIKQTPGSRALSLAEDILTIHPETLNPKPHNFEPRPCRAIFPIFATFKGQLVRARTDLPKLLEGCCIFFRLRA